MLSHHRIEWLQWSVWTCRGSRESCSYCWSLRTQRQRLMIDVWRCQVNLRWTIRFLNWGLFWHRIECSLTRISLIFVASTSLRLHRMSDLIYLCRMIDSDFLRGTWIHILARWVYRLLLRWIETRNVGGIINFSDRSMRYNSWNTWGFWRD